MPGAPASSSCGVWRKAWAEESWQDGPHAPDGSPPRALKPTSKATLGRRVRAGVSGAAQVLLLARGVRFWSFYSGKPCGTGSAAREQSERRRRIGAIDSTIREGAAAPLFAQVRLARPISAEIWATPPWTSGPCNRPLSSTLRRTSPEWPARHAHRLEHSWEQFSRDSAAPAGRFRAKLGPSSAVRK